MAGRRPSRPHPPQDEADSDHAAKLTGMAGRLSDMALTAYGIIQGVSLGVLGLVVANDHEQFVLTQWLMVLCVFAILINAWYELLVHIQSFEFLATYREAAAPFILGGLEMFLAYTISGGLVLWLWAFAVLALFAVLANWGVRRRAREVPTNRLMLRLTARGARIHAAVTSGVILLSGAGAIAATILRPDLRSPVAVLLVSLSLVCEFVYAISLIAYWREPIRALRGNSG